MEVKINKEILTIRSQCFLDCRFGGSFFLSLPAVWQWAYISCSARKSERKTLVGIDLMSTITI